MQQARLQQCRLGRRRCSVMVRMVLSEATATRLLPQRAPPCTAAAELAPMACGKARLSRPLSQRRSRSQLGQPLGSEAPAWASRRPGTSSVSGPMRQLSRRPRLATAAPPRAVGAVAPPWRQLSSPLSSALAVSRREAPSAAPLAAAPLLQLASLVLAPQGSNQGLGTGKCRGQWALSAPRRRRRSSSSSNHPSQEP